MTDIVYRVLVDIGTKGNLRGDLGAATSGASSLDSALRKVGDLAIGVGGSVAGVFTGAVEAAGALTARMGILAGAAGFGAITYGVVQLNAQLESAQIGIAAVLNAQGMSNGMADAMKLAGDQMQHLRKQAAELPGEFGDLRQFFTLGLNQALNKGMDLNAFREMAGNAMATAASVGVPMDQAAREFAQLLGGRSGMHNVFGTQLGLQGAESQKFNAAGPAEQVKMLTDRLAKFNPAIAEFKKSWDGLSSTAIDNVKRFAQMATAPIFGRIKQTFGEFNNWFDGHTHDWEALANKIGRDLAHAFDVAKSKAMEWGPVFAQFAGNAWDKLRAFWVDIEPIVGRIAGYIKDMMMNPATFDKIGDILKLYTVTKIGGPAISAASSGIGSLIPAGAGLGASAAIAGPAVAALGIVAFGVGEELNALADKNSKYHDRAEASMAKFQAATDRLSTTFSTNLGPAAENVGTALFSFWASGIDFWSKFWQQLFDMPSRIENAVIESVIGLSTTMTKTSQNAWEASGTTRPGYELGGTGGYAMSGGKLVDNTAEAIAKRVALPPVTQTFKVELVVNSNQDPMRIAEQVMDKIDQASRRGRSETTGFRKK